MTCRTTSTNTTMSVNHVERGEHPDHEIFGGVFPHV